MDEALPAPAPSAGRFPVPAAVRSPVLDRIAAMLPRLSRAERRVADFLLADPVLFARLSIKSITSGCGASAPTIMRFCRAAGFAGLTDLKLTVVSGLGASGGPIGERNDAASGGKLLDTTGDVVACLRKQCERPQMADAAALIARSSSVTCMASHDILQAASYARDTLLRHGFPALTPDAPGYAGAPGNGLGAATTGLFFCHGTPGAAMIDAITRYRAHGVGAVVVGDMPVAPFAHASVQILTGLPCNAVDPAHASLRLFPHLLVTDLLVARAAGEARKPGAGRA